MTFAAEYAASYKRARPRFLQSSNSSTAFLTTVTLPVHSAHQSIQICRRTCSVRVNHSRAARLITRHPKSPVHVSMSMSSERFQENLTNVSDSVIKAVESLSRQPRQTVEDIAAAAGLSVSSATDEAVKLAALTGASIDVTDDGDIAYRFPSNVRGVLRARSLRASLAMTWQRIAPAVLLGGRIAFGALLIISIVVTFVAILAISSANRSEDDRRSDRGSMFAPRFFFGPDIFDVMFYSRAYGYPPYYYRRGRSASGDERKQMSFLESVYSFVFGDGDPNFNFEERRWKTVAALIRANRGAVTAEQLAPLLDPPADRDESSAVVDESFVLPALTRFQGHPEVTSSGDIIYVFPNFMKTGARSAGSVEIVGTRSSAPAVEQELELTQAPSGQRALVLALGAVNLLGVTVLGGKLLSAVPVTRDAAQFLGFIRSVYPALLTYASSFFAVPFFRWIGLRGKNAKIRERNQARAESARKLARADSEVRRKIRAAEDFAVRSSNVRAEDIVYSSDRDSLDQRFLQDDMTEEFDRKRSS